MAVRRVLQITDTNDKKILKAKARPVKLPNLGLRALIEDMIETMHKAEGVGIAAPQIGISQRIAVISIPPEVEKRDDGTEVQVAPEQNFILINPEIVKASREEKTGAEGCLSLPNWLGDVPRAAWVTVDFQDIYGKHHRLRKADGLLAVALQHEIDHLDGVLFTERIRDLSTLKDYTEEIKEREREQQAKVAAQQPVMAGV